MPREMKLKVGSYPEMDIQSMVSSMGRTMTGLEDNTSSKRGKLVGTRFRFNRNLKKEDTSRHEVQA